MVAKNFIPWQVYKKMFVIFFSCFIIVCLNRFEKNRKYDNKSIFNNVEFSAGFQKIIYKWNLWLLVLCARVFGLEPVLYELFTMFIDSHIEYLHQIFFTHINTFCKVCSQTRTKRRKKARKIFCNCVLSFSIHFWSGSLSFVSQNLCALLYFNRYSYHIQYRFSYWQTLLRMNHPVLAEAGKCFTYVKCLVCKKYSSILKIRTPYFPGPFR